MIHSGDDWGVNWAESRTTIRGQVPVIGDIMELQINRVEVGFIYYTCSFKATSRSCLDLCLATQVL